MEPVFQLIGSIRDIPLYYTAPAALPKVRTDAEFDALMAYLRRIKTKWIWIVDCSGLTMEYCANIRYAQRLAETLRTEHAYTLQATWMLHVNPWVRGLLTLFATEVTHLSPDKLELFVQLQRAGCAHKTVDFLLTKVKSSC
jgi:hypothetical protein